MYKFPIGIMVDSLKINNINDAIKRAAQMCCVNCGWSGKVVNGKKLTN